MSYKVTLEVYVNKNTTWPRIQIESTPKVEEFVRHDRVPTDIADVEAFEDVLTQTRQFAETLTRGVEVVER